MRSLALIPCIHAYRFGLPDTVSFHTRLGFCKGIANPVLFFFFCLRVVPSLGHFNIGVYQSLQNLQRAIRGGVDIDECTLVV